MVDKAFLITDMIDGSSVKQKLDKIKEKGVDVTAIDALSLALEAGNKKSVNIVLLGVVARHSDIPYDTWIDAIKKTVKPQFVDVNIEAFKKGYEA